MDDGRERFTVWWAAVTAPPSAVRRSEYLTEATRQAMREVAAYQEG